jgi:hypothetical protein
MLITEGYRELQHEMHRNARYGAASMKFAGKVRALIQKHKPESVLDYGAGKRLLRTAIRDVDLFEYDPCIPEIVHRPLGKFDLVCCLDVLEHVEPDCLDEVLADLVSLTGRVAFMTIHTGPAGKFMSDGRNAHLIQKPMAWWREALSRYFSKVDMAMENETTITVLCEP